MALNTITGGYILQGSHQPRTPGKVRELKICFKIQGKVRELLRKWLIQENVREFESLYFSNIFLDRCQVFDA